MLICVLLAIACVAAIVAWGGLGIVAPAVEASGGRMAVATRRYLWWADLRRGRPTRHAAAGCDLT
jgi:hypothetical protein